MFHEGPADVTPYILQNTTYSVVLTTNGSTGINFSSREDTAHPPQLVLQFGNVATTFGACPERSRRVGNYWELTLPNANAVKYYYFGAQRVAMRGSSEAVYYLHTDPLNSIGVTTDGSQNVLGTRNYFPFGYIRVRSGDVKTNYAFTGQRLETTDGLMYYQARDYEDKIGRFTQPDSMAPNVYNPQDLNRYTYASNNPLRHTDPSGHCDPDYCTWTPQPDVGPTSFVMSNWQPSGVADNPPPAPTNPGSAPATTTTPQDPYAGSDYCSRHLCGGANPGSNQAAAAAGAPRVVLISNPAQGICGEDPENVDRVEQCLGGEGGGGAGGPIDVQPNPAPAPPEIIISPNAWDHVVQGHTATGSDSFDNSIFFSREDIRGLVQQAGSTTPTLQPWSGNYQRVVTADHLVGYDRTTGQLTNTYTVITGPDGRTLVTAFPGTPGGGGAP